MIAVITKKRNKENRLGTSSLINFIMSHTFSTCVEIPQQKESPKPITTNMSKQKGIPIFRQLVSQSVGLNLKSKYLNKL